MTVGELRKALRGLPADMPVACNETHLTSGMAVAVMRYHFAASAYDKKRYCDGLWITWSGSYQFCRVTEDGRVVNTQSGHQPELQEVRHDDWLSDPKWPTIEVPR